MTSVDELVVTQPEGNEIPMGNCWPVRILVALGTPWGRIRRRVWLDGRARHIHLVAARAANVLILRLGHAGCGWGGDGAFARSRNWSIQSEH